MAYRNIQDGNYLEGVQCPNCHHFAAKFRGGLSGCAGQLVAGVAVLIALAGIGGSLTSIDKVGIVAAVGSALIFVVIAGAVVAVARRVAGIGGYGCTNCGYKWKGSAAPAQTAAAAPTSPGPASTGPSVAPPVAPSTAGELERLAALHASGALTDQEYAAAKSKLLGGSGQGR